MQIDKGEDYPLLHPAYFIGILDFPFGTDTDYNIPLTNRNLEGVNKSNIGIALMFGIKKLKTIQK
jgi:hypothetical protein